jgi:hypothetical protein
MRRRIVVLVAAAAVLGLLWATRWVVLWELSLAFRPLPSAGERDDVMSEALLELSDRSFAPGKMDWRVHLALAQAGRYVEPPGESGNETEWRLQHLAEALKTCPPSARAAVHVAQVKWAWFAVPGLGYSGWTDEERAAAEKRLQEPRFQEALARLRELGIAGQQADPDNGYFDTALAYAAFAAKDRDAGARSFVEASRKPWRAYIGETVRAVGAANVMARTSPPHDPLFALVGAAPIEFPDFARLRTVSRAVDDAARAYAQDGRAREGRELAQAIAAWGERIRDNAFLYLDREIGALQVRTGLRTDCELAIRYATPEEAIRACKELDRFGTASRADGRAPYARLFPFDERLNWWQLTACPLFTWSIGIVRFLGPLLLALVALRLGGVARWPTPSVSRGVVALVLGVGLAAPLLMTGPWHLGLLGGDKVIWNADWSSLARPATRGLVWLLPACLMLFVAAVGGPAGAPEARRSRAVRVFLAVSFSAAVAAGLAAAAALGAHLLGVRDLESWEITEPPALATALITAAALAVSIWAGVLLWRGVPRPGLSEPPGQRGETPTSGWRETAGRFCWLAIRLLVLCAAVVIVGLFWHLFFLHWIGGDASGILQRGEVPLLEWGGGRL